jgi:hypothetical protein
MNSPTGPLIPLISFIYILYLYLEVKKCIYIDSSLLCMFIYIIEFYVPIKDVYVYLLT